MIERVHETAAKVIRRIGPDHPITVKPAGHRVRVRVGDTVIADTADALVLREADYPPVYYVPPAAIDASLLRHSDTTSYCPYKGEATYYSVLTEGGEVTDAGWTYRTPYQDVAAIADHVAFYPNRAEITVDD